MPTSTVELLVSSGPLWQLEQAAWVVWWLVGGACVAGNAMVQGLARLTGLRVLDVPGATGSLDTDYRMKARAALSALEEYNFCLVHIEARHESLGIGARSTCPH